MTDVREVQRRRYIAEKAAHSNINPKEK